MCATSKPIESDATVCFHGFDVVVLLARDFGASLALSPIMTLLYLSPEDRCWAKRRLKTTVHLGLICAVLGFAMRLSAGPSTMPSDVARGTFRFHEASTEDVWSDTGLLAIAKEHQLVATSAFGGPIGGTDDQLPAKPRSKLEVDARSIPPAGWRKTSRGWEHTSSWPGLGPTINDLIATQESSEPQWVRTSLAKVKSVPPITVALIQLLAIAAIAGIARLHQNMIRQ